MSYRAMLDTNIVSNALRFPNGNAAARMTEPDQKPICVSVVVAEELYFGARKVRSEKLFGQIAGILRTIDVLPIDEPVAHAFAEIRAHLEHSGTPIGPYDMLIAAHALALDLPLVTANIGEFARVPDLRLENWLD
ncbi:type II toxin-antitoxin system VapC family toxin [Devosia sp. FKR38]|uniref:type II toxin-antitoxin system VapC family toxin n=1 Tax=Devosia sp. FKR38 TaxID=2562312 RepID=UPI0010BF82A1|nr:type II toxin-antitoxin system VapC family toxin [Devosia sp. FKR38]